MNNTILKYKFDPKNNDYVVYDIGHSNPKNPNQVLFVCRCKSEAEAKSIGPGATEDVES